MQKLLKAGGAIALSLLLASSAGAQDRPVASNAGEHAVAPGAPCRAASGRLPDSITLQDHLLPRVQTMLHRSPTFRAQCQRLADAPWMHVAVRIEPDISGRRFRATSVIQRPQPHLFIAVVTLHGFSDPAMWLAHEFEHLIEQVDHVDVKRLASTRSGVWHSAEGMLETARAVRAGQLVFDEVVQKPDEHNFVD